MKTEIVFILDESGSMYRLKDDAIGGYNAFVEEQQKQEGEANLTLVTFNNNYNVVISGEDIKSVEPLTDLTYHPSGGTALLDAIGKAIESLIEREEIPEQIIFAIMTDGEENSSREFSRKEVFRLIKSLQKFGKVQFIFLGANQDAIGEASSLGIRSENAMNFNATGQAVMDTYSTLSKATSYYRSSGTLDGFDLKNE